MPKSLATVAIIALVLLVAANFVLDYRRNILEPGGASIGDVSRAVILPNSIAEAAKSVFLVIGANQEGHMQATAFLVDRNCGAFATNAHVADFVRDGGLMEVLEPETGRHFPVASYKIHPARDLLQEAVDEYGPILLFDDDTFQPVTVYWGYDAALLYVEGADCNDPAKLDLPPALRVADGEGLNGLTEGSPIALIGYQGSGTTTKALEDLTVMPRIEVGHVRGIGSYIPRLAGSPPQDARVRQLVLHTLTTTHGTSGSPIINYRGDIVAINAGAASSFDDSTAEDLVSLERLAHRADVIGELMSGDEASVVGQYRTSFEASLAQFFPASEFLRYLSQNIVEAASQQNGTNIELANFETGQALFGDIQDSYTVPAGSFTSAFTFREPGRYSAGRVSLAPGQGYVLSAVDFDMELQISDEMKAQGYVDHLCPIRMAARIGGQGAYQMSQLNQVAFLGFPAAPVARDVDLVFWRHPNCSPTSLAFHLAMTALRQGQGGPRPNLSFGETLQSYASDAAQETRRFLHMKPRPLNREDALARLTPLGTPGASVFETLLRPAD